MAPMLGHKRSVPRLISPPFPTASSTMIFETARESRRSGQSVDDTDPSSLFTSGMLHQHLNRSYSPSEFDGPEIFGRPFHSSPENRSPDRLSPPKLSPQKTPTRRRRSSIIHSAASSTSPRSFKAGGVDNGVERALDNVMKSLRVMAMGTPQASPARDQSRWSSSSEESLVTEESGLWRSRKSEESTRSRITVGTVLSSRSNRSKKSKKSRRSEDIDRMDLEEEEVPPVPMPTTPGRRRRMMEGLVKRLGFTPKKKSAPAPAPTPTSAPESQFEIPTAPRVPRKSSFSTLRSAISKKTSTGTLRSIRSNKASHPFMGCGPTFDCEAFPPPVPRWIDGEHSDGCLPGTPRRRTPKSSIGQPRLQPSTSPNTFIKDHPRRAPETPKNSADDLPPLPVPDILHELGYDLHFAQQNISSHARPPTVSLQDKLRRAEAVTREARPEFSPEGRKAFESETRHDLASFSKAPSQNVVDATVDDPQATSTAPLTTRAAKEAGKPNRLINLLPKQQRLNLGFQTTPMTTSLQKKSAGPRTALGEKTNAPLRLGATTPNSISAVLAKANPLHPFAQPALPMTRPIAATRPSKRDPLGIIGSSGVLEPSHDLPFRAGGGDGWDTPAPGPDLATGYFDDTFPASHSYTHPFASGPDFTASPDISFETVSVPSLGRRGSNASMDSDLPTEEWELEAYLRELDRVDQERAQREVGVGR